MERSSEYLWKRQSRAMSPLLVPLMHQNWHSPVTFVMPVRYEFAFHVTYITGSFQSFADNLNLQGPAGRVIAGRTSSYMVRSYYVSLTSVPRE